MLPEIIPERDTRGYVVSFTHLRYEITALSTQVAAPPPSQSLTTFYVLLRNIILPHIVQPGALLEVGAAINSVVRKVVHFARITQIAQLICLEGYQGTSV